MNFEYNTVSIDFNRLGDAASRKLDEWGQYGWELVTVVATADDFIAVFKRALSN